MKVVWYSEVANSLEIVVAAPPLIDAMMLDKLLNNYLVSSFANWRFDLNDLKDSLYLQKSPR